MFALDDRGLDPYNERCLQRTQLIKSLLPVRASNALLHSTSILQKCCTHRFPLHFHFLLLLFFNSTTRRRSLERRRQHGRAAPILLFLCNSSY